MSDPISVDTQAHLNQRQQQDAIQQRLDQMPQRDVDAELRISASLAERATNVKTRAKQLEDAYVGLLDQVMDLQRQIASGEVDVKQAKKSLIELRRQLSNINVAANRTAAEASRIEKDKQDPRAHVARLTENYQALRR